MSGKIIDLESYRAQKSDQVNDSDQVYEPDMTEFYTNRGYVYRYIFYFLTYKNDVGKIETYSKDELTAIEVCKTADKIKKETPIARFVMLGQRDNLLTGESINFLS